MATTSRRRSDDAGDLRMEAGGVEDLVGVDVADPGDHVLVEQQRLELRRPAAQHGAELVRAGVVDERVDAEPGDLGELGVDVVGVVDDHLAERARVDEQQVGIAEVEDDMGVQRPLGAAVDEEQLAGHAQVDHQRVARVERAQEVLAAAPGGRERGAR